MFDKLKDLLASELSIDPAEITPEAELVNDLGINSIELTDLLLVCEDTFGVKIEDEDAHGFITVGDVVSFLEKNAK
jgi:acyl carrier protein